MNLHLNRNYKAFCPKYNLKNYIALNLVTFNQNLKLRG